ncbi:MAG: hypothetical protein MGF17_11390 [Trichodesmium sp. MAG_R04]|nr:hypothetical protein [Trichodesmium sp. MAG_R04]
MIIRENFRLIIPIIFILIVPPSIIIDKKANINSQALVNITKNESNSISQNNRKTEIKKLEQQATREFDNSQFEFAVEKFITI